MAQHSRKQKPVPSPLDFYRALNFLATDLVNLSADGDAQAYDIVYDAVRYLSRKYMRGMDDPTLPEVLGDFSRDPHESARFYRAALGMARAQDCETFTILLGLGRVHRSEGKNVLARRYFNEAIHDAKRRRNRECRNEALEELAALENAGGVSVNAGLKQLRIRRVNAGLKVRRKRGAKSGSHGSNRRRKQLRLIGEFGTVDYDPKYDYKARRKRR